VISSRRADPKSRPCTPFCRQQEWVLQGDRVLVSLASNGCPISRSWCHAPQAIGTPRRCSSERGSPPKLGPGRSVRPSKPAVIEKTAQRHHHPHTRNPTTNAAFRSAVAVSTVGQCDEGQPHAFADPTDVMARKMLMDFCESVSPDQIPTPEQADQAAQPAARQSRPARKNGRRPEKNEKKRMKKNGSARKPPARGPPPYERSLSEDQQADMA